MDRNNIIGFALIFAVIIISSIFFAPSQEERETAQRHRDSIAMLRQQEQELENSVIKPDTAIEKHVETVEQPAQETEQEVLADTLVNNELRDRFGAFYGAASGTERFIHVESKLLRLRFSSKGGRLAYAELKEFVTFDTLPLVLFDENSSRLGFTFFAGNRRIVSDEMFFTLHGIEDDTVYVKGTDSLVFSMRLHTSLNDTALNMNEYIEMRYVIHPQQYHLGFGIDFVGLKDVVPMSTTYIQLEWMNHLKQQEKSLQNERMASTIYYKPLADKVDYITERKDGKESVKSKVKWVSFKQQFFTQTLIARNEFESIIIETETADNGEKYVKTCSAVMEIPLSPYLESNLFEMELYLGPNKYNLLNKYNLDMERQIPLGWGFAPMAWINRFAVIPVFNFLEGYNFNYGIIILLLTILLKVVLFPIAYKTYMSSAKMRVLKPDVEEIGKRFPKKEDSVKKQQATMDLYKRAGVNPMAGCVPMLLQLPILIALFRFFPASFELRQQGFLWANDLSTYDSILELPFTIPFYGAHVSLFTLLMTISTLIYTRMNNEMMSSNQQMPGMKTMMYMMPIMFLGFFNSYASGLSYYYLLANLITFAQMFVFRKMVDEDKIRMKIAENKKKPVKKSAFAKRLEEMTKQKGQNSKR
jgi:YidC/Oxa1 family membrane protein insertase